MWYNIVHDLENKFNNTKHHSTLYTPNSVNQNNSEIVFRNQYRKLINMKRRPEKFKIGELVRIEQKRNVFSKSYTPQYSKKIYQIIKVKKNWPASSYILEDRTNKQQLDRQFVEEELSPASDN